MLAIVIDVSWYWINSNRIQKAADAAALAGVVWLPGDQSKAVQTAIYEAAKNGYTVASSGVPLNGVTITAAKAAGNDRLLNVTISAPVSTFFMRVFGLNSDPGQPVRTGGVCPPSRDGEPGELLRRVRRCPGRDDDRRHVHQHEHHHRRAHRGRSAGRHADHSQARTGAPRAGR